MLSSKFGMFVLEVLILQLVTTELPRSSKTTKGIPKCISCCFYCSSSLVSSFWSTCWICSLPSWVMRSAKTTKCSRNKESWISFSSSMTNGFTKNMLSISRTVRIQIRKRQLSRIQNTWSLLLSRKISLKEMILSEKSSSNNKNQVDKASSSRTKCSNPWNISKEKSKTWSSNKTSQWTQDLLCLQSWWRVNKRLPAVIEIDYINFPIIL